MPCITIANEPHTYDVIHHQFGRLFPNAASFAAKPLREKLKDAKGIGALCGQGEIHL